MKKAGNSVLYGTETLKALNNFPLIDVKLDPDLIKSVAFVKKAAANANYSLGILPENKYDAITRSCDEVIEGKLDEQFPLTPIQGGAGTSINMNVNEVVAARSMIILKNSVSVDPISDVNLSQSTNDVVPSALKLCCLTKLDKYLSALEELKKIFVAKSEEYKGIKKVARTHLQDAVPIDFYSVFLAYANIVNKDIERLVDVKKYLLQTNLGGTAIGTGVNAPANFSLKINEYLSLFTSYKFKSVADKVEATQNIDTFQHVMFLLSLSAVGLSKICSDLGLMASGPRAGFYEINIPVLQNGSSIMPGKNNPVTFEMINQISNLVTGNAMAGIMALNAGQFELNVMITTYYKTIPESFNFLTEGTTKLADVIAKISVNSEKCRESLNNSLVYATELSAIIGYSGTSEIVKRSVKNNSSLEQEFKRSKYTKNTKACEVLKRAGL